MNKDDFKIDFVGIGAMKAATTWIYECLQEHPEIELALKDQRDKALFFREDLSSYLEEYRSYFKEKETLKGDFHVQYFSHEEVIPRMKSHNPNLKIITCLRNPVERAWSHYRYYKFTHNEQVSFEEAVKKAPAILDIGLYHKHLKKYYQAFPEENILVLLFENIKKDKLGFIQEAYNFLNAKEDFTPPSLEIRTNYTNFKLTRAGRFLHQRLIKPLLNNTTWAWSLKRSVFLKKLLGKLSTYYGKSQKKEKMNKELRKSLLSYYREDIDKLEKLTGKDLNHWK